jgi:hypothetical protein
VSDLADPDLGLDQESIAATDPDPEIVTTVITAVDRDREIVIVIVVVRDRTSGGDTAAVVNGFARGLLVAMMMRAANTSVRCLRAVTSRRKSRKLPHPPRHVDSPSSVLQICCAECVLMWQVDKYAEENALRAKLGIKPLRDE